MKEFALKHPILTFLLVDGVIAGLFRTIQAFAPNGESNGEKTEEEDKSVADPEEGLVQQIDKEEKK